MSRSALRLALSLVVWAIPGLALPVQAAFEWEHPTPESLVAGDSPARWPVAGEGMGFRADAIAARPWSWPGVGAEALRIGGRGSRLAAGIAFSQLRAPGYRESRLATGLEQALSGQRLALVLSRLDALIGEEPAIAPRSRSGSEIDLGWSLASDWLDIAVRSHGAWRTRGAQRLGSPRRFRAHLGAARSLVRTELVLEEGSSGRRLSLGLKTRPFDAVDLGAAWSSAEPPIRLFVALRRNRFALSAGWAWHSTLPATHVVGLSLGDHAAAPAEIRP